MIYQTKNVTTELTSIFAIIPLQFVFDKESNRIFVRFTLLGAPTGVKGDVEKIEDQLDLDQAEQYLSASLKNHQFLVYYLQQDGKVSETIRSKKIQGTVNSNGNIQVSRFNEI